MWLVLDWWLATLSTGCFWCFTDRQLSTKSSREDFCRVVVGFKLICKLHCVNQTRALLTQPRALYSPRLRTETKPETQPSKPTNLSHSQAKPIHKLAKRKQTERVAQNHLQDRFHQRKWNPLKTQKEEPLQGHNKDVVGIRNWTHTAHSQRG